MEERRRRLYPAVSYSYHPKLIELYMNYVFVSDHDDSVYEGAISGKLRSIFFFRVYSVYTRVYCVHTSIYCIHYTHMYILYTPI